MNRVLVLVIFALAACTRPSQLTKPAVETPVQKKQSKEDLVAELKKNGIFQSVQTSALDSSYQVVKTTEDDDYFIQNGVVVSSSRAPRKHEKTLIYWRYQFKGKKYVETKINENGSVGHNLPMLQLACDSDGIGVVYDPNSEKITRVFYYEAH